MLNRLLATKFHIPPWRITGVSRVSLIDRLTTGLLEGSKLTLVSAPAGYGKTTLISEWIYTLGESLQIAWISLDEGDNDLNRFLNYWLSAFQSIDESVGLNAKSLLPLPQIPSLHAILDELLNDLVSLEIRVMMVLDDYHTITNPQIHDAVEYFIEHQPAKVHLIITTREDPPFLLSRMRARRQMTEIRAIDLRFTQDEAQQFFNQSMNLELPEKTINTIEVRTEGWAVGLQLAALALQNLPNPHEFIRTFNGTHRYILDYLAEEVLRQKDEGTRNYLFQTAVLEKFNASLCNSITGRSDSQELLHELEQANLFITPLDNERNWYRYHPLFADYLRTGLTITEQARLHELASQWYEANDLAFEAVKHAFLSENLEETVNVIERVIQKPTVWSGGEISILVGWLDALPSQLLQSKPALCLHASRAWYIAGRINLSEKYLDLAEQALRESPTLYQHTRTLLAISAERRAALAALRGDISFAIERATYALTQLPEDGIYDRARANAMLGLAYGLKGDLKEASHLLISASDLSHTVGVSFMAVMTRCEAALLQITQGKLPLATEIVQQAIHFSGETQIPPLGFAKYVLAEIAWKKNELVSAEKYLMEGIEISNQGILIDDLRFELMMLAHLKKSTGDLTAALTAIEQAHSICQSFEIPRLITLSSAHCVRIQLANGMLEEVNQWAQQYQEFRDSMQVEYIREYEDLTLARVFLVNKEYEPALELLTLLYEKANSSGRIRTCIEAAILLSLVGLAQKKPTTAQEWLVKALTLAAPEGFLRLFLDEGPIIADQLPKIRHRAPGFVDQLLETFSYQSQKTNLIANTQKNQKLVNPLSEQELCVLSLIITGKSNQEIAEELFISNGTAKWHVHNVLQKLGVSNRPQAIAIAREMGI